MSRTSWPTQDARKIQKRLDNLVEKRFGGVQARFVEKCGVTRDTASKWFGAAARTPDTLTLARVAERCGVSLDWLVLGRGEMDWPRPATRGAKTQLFDEVYEALKREGDRATLHVLNKRLGNAPESLWKIVVSEASQLPSIEDEAEELRTHDHD